MVTPPVLELRVALTAQDFDRLASFYRQGLGLEPSQTWSPDQGRALVLDLSLKRAQRGGVPVASSTSSSASVRWSGGSAAASARR